MSRKGLTELAIIVEKNNHITKNAGLLKEMLRKQAMFRNKIKITLFPFQNDYGFISADFKNLRDLDLDSINNDDISFTTCLHKSIELCIEQILYRYDHICKCRIPEQTYILIIAETSPLSPYNLILPGQFEYKLVIHDTVNTSGIPIGTTNTIRYNELTEPNLIISQINDDLMEFRQKLI